MSVADKRKFASVDGLLQGAKNDPLLAQKLLPLYTGGDAHYQKQMRYESAISASEDIPGEGVWFFKFHGANDTDHGYLAVGTTLNEAKPTPTAKPTINHADVLKASRKIVF